AGQSNASSGGMTAETDQSQKKKKKAEQQATGESATTAEAGQDQKKQQAAGESTKTASTGDAAEFLADTRSLDSLDVKTLHEKVKTARVLIKGGSLSSADEQKVREIM